MLSPYGKLYTEITQGNIHKVSFKLLGTKLLSVSLPSITSSITHIVLSGTFFFYPTSLLLLAGTINSCFYSRSQLKHVHRMPSLIPTPEQISAVCSHGLLFSQNSPFSFLFFLVYSSVFMSYKVCKSTKLVFLLHLCIPRVWGQKSLNRYLLNEWVILSNTVKKYIFLFKNLIRQHDENY